MTKELRGLRMVKKGGEVYINAEDIYKRWVGLKFCSKDKKQIEEAFEEVREQLFVATFVRPLYFDSRLNAIFWVFVAFLLFALAIYLMRFV